MESVRLCQLVEMLLDQQVVLLHDEILITLMRHSQNHLEQIIRNNKLTSGTVGLVDIPDDIIAADIH